MVILIKQYKGKKIHLGSLTLIEGEKRRTQARAFIKRVCEEMGRDPSYDSMKRKLEEAKIREIKPRTSKNSSRRNGNGNDNNQWKRKRTDLKQSHNDGGKSSQGDGNVTSISREFDKNVKRQCNESHRAAGFRSFQLHLISLPEQGSMGMQIIDNDETEPSQGCRVQSLTDSGQAKRHGVQVNDEIFSSRHNFDPNETGQNLNPISCEEMMIMSQSSKRPINFIVKRIQKDTTRTHYGHGKDVEKQAEVKKTKVKHGIPTKKQIELALKGKGFPPVPCCKKCNRDAVKSTTHHHYLCPKHEDFSASGAKDKLILILAGIRDGCETCKYEFEHGRSNHGGHIRKCGRSSASCSKKKQHDTPKSKSAKSTKKIPPKITKKKCSKKIDIKSKNRKDVENKSATPVSRPTSSFKSPPIKKSHSVVKVTETQEKRSEIVNVVPVTPTVSVEYKPSSSNTKKASPLCLTDDFSIAQWVPCPNPWGDRLHNEGDFILTSPSCYSTAFKVQGSNPARFTTDPFQCNNLHYNKTHKTPQEGYRVLQLRRDNLALRSWGFTFCHHEFGGACLVTEVEVLSPAEAAVSQIYFP